MKWLAGIALAILALVAIYGGLWEWTRSGHAPRFVTVPYDRVSALFNQDRFTRCALPDRTINGIEVANFLPDRECFDWQAPREFVGIFVNEFEGDRFLEAVRPAGAYCPKDDVWLDFDQKSDLRGTPQLKPFADVGARIWLISFVGRKTEQKGHYGHMGMSTEQITVDRTIAARLLAQFPGYVPDAVLRCR